MKKKAVAIWTAILLCVTLVVPVFAACTEDNATAIELEVDTSYKIEQPLEGAVFSTEDDNIAGVSEDGYIVGVNEGKTTVTETNGTQTRTYRVTVTDNTYDDDDKGFGNFTDVDDITGFVGAGYNVIASDFINGNDANITYPVFDPDKLIDSGSLRINRNNRKSSTVRVEGESMESFMEDYAKKTSISVGASFGNFFSASVDVAFSTTAKNSLVSNSKFMRFHANVQEFAVSLASGESKYSDFLSDEFQKDLVDPEVTAEELFAKYGTHVIISAVYGGRLDFNYYLYSTETSTTTEDINSIGGKLSANISSFGLNGSVQLDNSYKSEAASKKIEIATTTNTFGGDPAVNMSSIDAMAENYSEWLSSISATPTLIGTLNANSLYPIWKLLPDTEEGRARARELEEDFNYLAKNTYDNLISDYYTQTQSIILRYGSYPQSRADAVVTAALNAGKGEVAEDYFLNYGDIISYGGDEYLKYVPTETHNGYNAGQTYYFKFEDIVWRYYDTDSNGQRLYTSDKILDASKYYDENFLISGMNRDELTGQLMDLLWREQEIDYYYDKYLNEKREGEDFVGYISRTANHFIMELVGGTSAGNHNYWENSTVRTYLNGFFHDKAFRTENTYRLGYVHYYNSLHPKEDELTLSMDVVSVAPFMENYYGDGMVVTDFAWARGATDNRAYWGSVSDFVDPNFCGFREDWHGVFVPHVQYDSTQRYWYNWCATYDTVAGIKPTIAIRK